MIDLLRLTRPINLLIIALTMYLMRSRVLGTLLEAAEGSLLMSPLDFLLLVISTVLIAAGGNVINDYFDTRIDRINRPHNVIVGRTVKRRVAMVFHVVLSAVGLVIGLFVAWHTGQHVLALIPVFSIGALWTYSTTFKRRFLIGNGLVAVLTALVPLSVGLYEIPMQHQQYAGMLQGNVRNAEDLALFLNVLWSWIIGYSAFAFLSTLVRELQKDMADMKGDVAAGCRTVPIVLGQTWARVLVITYIFILVIGLLAIRRVYLNDEMSFWYFGIGIIAPLLLSAGFTYNARTRREHNTAGMIMKFAMVMAVGFSFLIRFMFIEA